MLNKRKALIGWLVYTAAKPIVKRVVASKAKSAVPRTREGSKAPNTAAIALGVAAAVAGVLLFWRSRSSDEDEPAG